MTERTDWHQEDFFSAYDETLSVALPEAPEHAMLREVMSEYLNLESLRFLASEVAAADLRFALRYAPDELPEHIARLVDTIKVILSGRLEIQHRRDTMIGLCIGMRQPRWYDGILNRLNRRTVDLDRTDFRTPGRAWSAPNR